MKKGTTRNIYNQRKVLKNRQLLIRLPRKMSSCPKNLKTKTKINNKNLMISMTKKPSSLLNNIFLACTVLIITSLHITLLICTMSRMRLTRQGRPWFRSVSNNRTHQIRLSRKRPSLTWRFLSQVTPLY